MKRITCLLISSKYGHRLLSIFFLILIAFQGFAKTSSSELLSPNRQIKVAIDLADKIYYSVSLNGQLLLENSSLQMELPDETLGENPKLSASKTSTINENIKRPIPLRNAVVSNHCNVLLLKFKGDYSVEFRAYNDGVAYRFITSKGKKDLEILNEDVHLHFPETFDAVVTPTKSFKTSYEISYVKTNTADFANQEKSTLPVLVEGKYGVKILVSEADLFDYPCFFLKGKSGNAMNGVSSKMSN